jgi:hypothetical protein
MLLPPGAAVPTCSPRRCVPTTEQQGQSRSPGGSSGSCASSTAIFQRGTSEKPVLSDAHAQALQPIPPAPERRKASVYSILCEDPSSAIPALQQQQWPAPPPARGAARQLFPARRAQLEAWLARAEGMQVGIWSMCAREGEEALERPGEGVTPPHGGVVNCGPSTPQTTPQRPLHTPAGSHVYRVISSCASHPCKSPMPLPAPPKTAPPCTAKLWGVTACKHSPSGCRSVYGFHGALNSQHTATPHNPRPNPEESTHCWLLQWRRWRLSPPTRLNVIATCWKGTCSSVMTNTLWPRGARLLDPERPLGVRGAGRSSIEQGRPCYAVRLWISITRCIHSPMLPELTSTPPRYHKHNTCLAFPRPA